MRGLPALLPVVCSKTHDGGSARKILYNTSPYFTVISESLNVEKKIKSSPLKCLAGLLYRTV